MSARFALKAATEDRHEKLDAHFAALNLSDREDYATFLSALAGALIPYEEALDNAGAASVLPGWEHGRRTAALVADLDSLERTIPDPVAVQAPDGEPGILGVSYVLEGSRIGARMLVRAVPEEFPRAFLTHDGGMAWRDFVALLEQKLARPVDRAVAERASIRAFDDFSRAAGIQAGRI